MPWDRPTLVVAAAVALAACQAGPHVDQAQGPRKAAAHLLDARGESKGDVELTDRPDRVDAKVHLYGLAPGSYVLALHGRGACDARDRAAAPHASGPLLRSEGDAAEIAVRVGAGGSADARRSVRGIAIASGPVSLLDGDGSSVLVTDAGGVRRACGVVRP